MQAQQLDKTAISISQDSMTAYLRLPEPLQGQKYLLEDIRSVIESAGVKVGIDEQAIQQMIDYGIYNRTMAVASGQAPQNGTDGYYEYKFQIGRAHV